MAKPFKVGDIVRGVELLELDEEKSTQKEKWWKYKCPTCGNIKSARSSHVGSLCKSCASKQRRAQRKTSCVSDDLTGRHFGYWLVLHKADRSNFWYCLCTNCGTERDVFRGSLTTGDSKSCGCIKSWGETQLIYLLNKYNISYKREITFQDLITDKGGHPRFDFGVYNIDGSLKCLIEYDGRQHEQFEENWESTKEDFRRLQYIDNLKNIYCIEHGIKLYRVNKDTILEDFILQSIVNKTVGGA